MITVLEQRVGGALAGLVAAVARRPVAVLGLALVLALGSGLYASRHLGVISDTDQLFDDDLPFRVHNDAFEAIFPALDEAIVVVVDAPSRAGAEDAVRALADRVRDEPALFESVFTPGVGPFWERHGLLYLEPAELEALADHLAEVQPLIAEVARDPSLRGIFTLLREALERMGDGSGDGLDAVRVFDALSRALGSASRLEPGRRSFGELVVGGEEPGDTVRRFAVVRPRLDFGVFSAAGPSLSRMREIVAELDPAAGPGLRVRLTGEIALQAEELDRVQRQAAAAGVASFLMVGAILGFALRAVRPIAAALLALGTGLAWTFGFAALAIGHLNLISVAFAVLFIGLGVDFGIHFASRYQELRARGGAHAEALEATARGVGSSLVLCAATTAIGFFAFAPTGYVGVAELGIIAGTGMLLSLAATLTVLPACLSLGGGSRSPRRPSELRLPSFPARHPAAVCTVAAVLGLAALWLAPRWHFDASPLRVRDPGSDAVRTFQELIEGGDVNPFSIDVVAPDLERARALAAEIAALPSVERAETLADFVPSSQDVKLAILEDADLFLGPALRSEPVAPPAPAESLEAIRAFRAALDRARFDDPLVAEAAARLAAALERFVAGVEGDEAAVLAALEADLVGSVRRGIDRLRTALRAGSVRMVDLPERLRERLLAGDGRARIEVHPREDLNDEAALRRFVREVSGVAPNATGTAVYMFESGREVLHALRQAFAAAFVLVVLLLWWLWRSARDAALAIAPLLLAALFTAATSVAIGLPLNFADVIVLPLLLGIGVDSGIHLVQRHRSEGDSAASLLRSSTSRAVLWSALTTIASFGTLGFASHRGMSSLGQLLTLGVALTLACNLLVLPAALALLERRRG